MLTYSVADMDSVENGDDSQNVKSPLKVDTSFLCCVV